MAEETKKVLTYKNRNLFDVLGEDEIKKAYEYADGYRAFLDAGKTEREVVAEAIRQAEAAGFRPIADGDISIENADWYVESDKLKPGDRVYKSVGGKALFLAVIGEVSPRDGANIAGAHVDSPRLDLKQLPLYEDGEMALFKTHYYGGVKKYQWVTLPLALHGIVIRGDGETVEVTIGEDGDEPVFFVSDLLPHLGKDQNKKTLGEAFTGEHLNILIGTRPSGGEKDTDRFKTTVLELLNEKYGIEEEDFLSAELEAVPAGRARDAGFDRSLILAYGHDDRSCVYAELRAILELGTPKKTAVCILTDKEEIGSEGVTGSQSAAFDSFMGWLTGGLCFVARSFERSFCISADVCNAFDPNYPEVSEKNNAAKLNHGVGIMKFTGSGGKSGSSDASAETVARLRRLFAENGVQWQMAELGKVDQGGGGTIAKYMANRNIATIDAGVPVISMHAPWETVSKLDCYMTYKGIAALYGSKD
ncbi:MAG: aminopeptidase [Oscillospiraceae bacterium]|jgi:aspartyl aminopeptidase|nr:aminopeptidase [Oscillospiraceae bacterium]